MPPKPRRPSRTPPRRRSAPPRPPATRPSSTRLRALVAEKKAEIRRPQRGRKGRRRSASRPASRLCRTCPAADIPDGRDETDNVEIRREGSPRNFSFKPLEHFEIPGRNRVGFRDRSQALGRPLRGPARQPWRGSTGRWPSSCSTPMSTSTASARPSPRSSSAKTAWSAPTNCLNSPKNSYQTTNGWWLIPTAEVTLTNSVREEMLDEENQLPSAHDRAHRLLPLRGRLGRQGHQGHAAPAPVREGRDGDRSAPPTPPMPNTRG